MGMELLKIMILYPEIKVLERFQKFRHRMQVTASFFIFGVVLKHVLGHPLAHHTSTQS